MAANSDSAEQIKVRNSFQQTGQFYAFLWQIKGKNFMKITNGPHFGFRRADTNSKKKTFQ